MEPVGVVANSGVNSGLDKPEEQPGRAEGKAELSRYMMASGTLMGLAEMPRMADFAVFAEAVGRGLGWPDARYFQTTATTGGRRRCSSSKALGVERSRDRVMKARSY